jgi:hypothetical protein
MNDQTAYILSLPSSQVKAIKRAIRILCAAGFDYFDAASLVIERHQLRARGCQVIAQTTDVRSIAR